MWKWFKTLFLDHPITPAEIDEAVSRAININYLKSMQKLDVKDGDTVVLTYPGKLNKETYAALKAAVEKIIKDFGFTVHVMILEEGMQIGLLRKEN